MLSFFVVLSYATSVTSQSLSIVDSEYCRYYDNCRQRPMTSSCSCDHLTCHTYDDCCQSLDEGNRTVAVSPTTSGAVSCISKHEWFSGVDASSFSMVTGCPADSDTTVSRLCSQYAHVDQAASFYQLPVFGKDSHILYGNYYCAVCNGEENVVYWNALRQCRQYNYVLEPLPDDDESDLENRDENQKEKRLRPPPEPRVDFVDCSLTFTPPAGGDSFPLSTCGVASCRTGWNDTEIAKRCHRSHSTLFVHSRNGIMYRNFECALCNGEHEHNLACSSETVYAQHPSNPPLSILINFNDASHDVHSTVWGNTKDNFKCPTGEFWDPFRTSCVTSFCPPGTTSDIKIGKSCQRLPSSGVAQNSLRGEVSSLSGRVSEQDPNVTAETPMTNCSYLIAYNETQYSVDQNGTVIVVSRPGNRYRAHEYFIRDSILFVCGPFEGTDVSRLRSFGADDALQRVLTLIGVILSLMLLLVLFVVYATFPVLRNTPGKCLMSLVASLFFGELLLLFAINWLNASHVVCVIQSIMMHYSWLAAFMWMNVLSFDVFRTFSNMSAAASSSRDAEDDASRCCPPGRFVQYSLYAWTLPSLLVGASLSYDLLGDEQSAYRPRYGSSYRDDGGTDIQVCWFNSARGLLVFFAAPIGLLLLVNVTLFVATTVHIYRTTEASRPAVGSASHGQQLVILYLKLFIVMGLTWSFGFFGTMTGWTAVWYIFTIFNSLQGAFIALSFLSSRHIRRLLHQSLADRGFFETPLTAATRSTRVAHTDTIT